MKLSKWHTCALCRLPNVPEHCTHANYEASSHFAYCPDCGAVAEVQRQDVFRGQSAHCACA